MPLKQFELHMTGLLFSRQKFWNQKCV